MFICIDSYTPIRRSKSMENIFGSFYHNKDRNGTRIHRIKRTLFVRNDGVSLLKDEKSCGDSSQRFQSEVQTDCEISAQTEQKLCDKQTQTSEFQMGFDASSDELTMLDLITMLRDKVNREKVLNESSSSLHSDLLELTDRLIATRGPTFINRLQAVSGIRNSASVSSVVAEIDSDKPIEWDSIPYISFGDDFWMNSTVHEEYQPALVNTVESNPTGENIFESDFGKQTKKNLMDDKAVHVNGKNDVQVHMAELLLMLNGYSPIVPTDGKNSMAEESILLEEPEEKNNIQDEENEVPTSSMKPEQIEAVTELLKPAEYDNIGREATSLLEKTVKEDIEMDKALTAVILLDPSDANDDQDAGNDERLAEEIIIDVSDKDILTSDSCAVRRSGNKFTSWYGMSGLALSSSTQMITTNNGNALVEFGKDIFVKIAEETSVQLNKSARITGLYEEVNEEMEQSEKEPQSLTDHKTDSNDNERQTLDNPDEASASEYIGSLFVSTQSDVDTSGENFTADNIQNVFKPLALSPIITTNNGEASEGVDKTISPVIVEPAVRLDKAAYINGLDEEVKKETDENENKQQALTDHEIDSVDNEGRTLDNAGEASASEYNGSLVVFIESDDNSNISSEENFTAENIQNVSKPTFAMNSSAIFSSVNPFADVRSKEEINEKKNLSQKRSRKDKIANSLLGD